MDKSQTLKNKAALPSMLTFCKMVTYSLKLLTWEAEDFVQLWRKIEKPSKEKVRSFLIPFFISNKLPHNFLFSIKISRDT